MSINFIIHSWLGQRRRAVDHTGGWCLQMDYDYEDLKMKHFSLQKGAARSADERKWIKWPVLNAAQTRVWVMSEENLRANMRLARVRLGLNAERLSWREVAGWHHITSIVLSSTIRILYSRTRGKCFKAAPWRVNTKLNSSLQISEPGQLFTELQTLGIPSDKRKWLH